MKERISDVPATNPPSVNSSGNVAEPSTEAEAADMLQRTAWKALAKLAGIIDSPNASDMMVIQAAREVAGQLQRRNAAMAENISYTMMGRVLVNGEELVLNVGDP